MPAGWARIVTMAIMTAAIIIRAAAFIVPRFVVVAMMFIVFLIFVIILVVIPDLGKVIRTELIDLHVRRDWSCQSRRNYQ